MRPSEADRARRSLAVGVLLFRWVALAWMTTLAFFVEVPFDRPEIAWMSLGAITAWTAWLTLSGAQDRSDVLWIDLVLGIALLLVSGVVIGPGDIVSPRPLFAAVYPVSSALLWGVLRGPVPGVIAGYALGAAYVLTRPVNGVSLGELSAGEIQILASGVVVFLLAGGVSGLISRLLERSARQLQAVTEEAMRARERAARLAEREALARQVHDSVLQVLALVHKRARELGQRERVAGTKVMELARATEEQERALRSLVLRELAESPDGKASLREALEAAAREIAEVAVTVTAVGPVWLPPRHVEEVSAAVRQALGNVVQHAGADRAFVYAEEDDGWVVVSVRDDGRGFVYDEEHIRAQGRAGLLQSMKGRIQDLGGSMRVSSEPGKGTEVEFRIPAGAAVA